MIVIIIIMFFFVSVGMLYVFGIQDNPRIKEYERARKRLVADNPFEEIEPYKPKPYGEIICLVIIGIVAFLWFTLIPLSFRAILYCYLLFSIYLALWYNFLFSRKTPPLLVFTTQGVLCTRFDDDRTKVIPINWTDVEVVNISPYEIKLTYMTYKKEVRTITIDTYLIGKNREKATQLFIQYGAKVNINEF